MSIDSQIIFLLGVMCFAAGYLGSLIENHFGLKIGTVLLLAISYQCAYYLCMGAPF